MNFPRYFYVIAVLSASSTSLAAEPSWLPEGVPPLTGTAVARAVEGDDSQWMIAVTMPRDTWREILVVMPKLESPEPTWKEVSPGIREGTMTLPMGDDSTPTLCRVIDMNGKKPSDDQILQQLKTKQPILVSATGQIPDARYLRLPTPAKLIVLLGPGAKQDVAKTKIPAENAKGERDVDLKDWTEEESKQYFFNLMQKSATFKIKSEEEASKYLQGIWRLDKRAHIGGGHYVRADRGEDAAVMCTDEWLVVRMMNGKQASDVTVARFERIETDERGHLHVKGKNPISFDHFMPLDKDHIAVLNYDFIAVMHRMTSKTPEPGADETDGQPDSAAENMAAEQIENDTIEAAKTHLRALLTCNEKVLSKSYAAKVRRLRQGDLLEREKVIAAALKQFAGGGDVPEEAIRRFIGRLKFEPLEVREGELVTSPSPAMATENGRLRFRIEKGDAVVKIPQGPSAWFLQLRKANSEWTVVAEYTD
jgi:hypothetical protein